MKRSLTVFGLSALAVLGLAAGIATSSLAQSGPPNQGDSDKVLTVPSGYACSGTAVPGDKVEGAGLGPTIRVTAATPIVKVTIKSGSKAELVSASWGATFLSGTITISQDVSNYVVWTCAESSTTGTTTGTTTDTTTETTTGTTTTTDTTTTAMTTTTTTATTSVTTETTPTTTETTPLVPSAPFTPPPAAAATTKTPAGPEAPARATSAKPGPPSTATRTTDGVAGATAQAPPQLAHTP